MRRSASISRRDTRTDPSWSIFAALSITLLVGCTERPLGDGDGGVTSTGEAITASPSTGSIDPTTSTSGVTTSGAVTFTGGVTSEPPPGTSTGSADTGCGQTTECNFLGCNNECPEVEDCPGTQQLDPECPDGHKCTIDGSVSETHCVEIVPEPKGLYEPCTVLGDGFSGLDDCGLGMLCWNPDERGQGVCFGMCDDQGDLGCVCADPGATPTLCQSCAVGLCIPGCDPLLQDCISDNEACYPINDGFSCVFDGSGEQGQANDPCEFVNACDEGLACVDSVLTSIACDPQALGCCTPFCEFPGGACPNPDQACVQWYEPGSAPPGDEDIGVCRIP